MIAYTKRLEFEIKRCLDTPLRMFRILLARHHSFQQRPPVHILMAQPHLSTSQYAPIKDLYFSEDAKQDDVAKVLKYAS